MKFNLVHIKLLVFAVLAGIFTNETSQFINSLETRDYASIDALKDKNYVIVEEMDTNSIDFFNSREKKKSISNQNSNLKPLSGIIYEIPEHDELKEQFVQIEKSPSVGRHVPIEQRFLCLQVTI
ncbi:MAG TPA: hypothetical protein VGF79_05380 [Bacteroidia bacterium]